MNLACLDVKIFENTNIIIILIKTIKKFTLLEIVRNQSA